MRVSLTVRRAWWWGGVVVARGVELDLWHREAAGADCTPERRHHDSADVTRRAPSTAHTVRSQRASTARRHRRSLRILRLTSATVDATSTCPLLLVRFSPCGLAGVVE